MRTLSAKVLLDAWEKCLDEPAALRASTLLAVATGEATPVEAARWTIGRRDSALLSLRKQLFGSSIEAIAACPKCSEQSEVTFTVDQIRVPQPAGGRANQSAAKTIRVGRRRVRYRAPNSEDLLAIAQLDDARAATSLLIERCVENAGQPERDAPREDISDEIAGRVLECIARDEAQADVQLTFNCPVCGHEWRTVFDIALFLWREVDDWARRILGEVDALARTYGWNESEILGLSARRRHTYLEMIGAS
jgi:hypothetical protein